jgi:hypothetical protein
MKSTNKLWHAGKKQLYILACMKKKKYWSENELWGLAFPNGGRQLSYVKPFIRSLERRGLLRSAGFRGYQLLFRRREAGQ